MASQAEGTSSSLVSESCCGDQGACSIRDGHLRKGLMLVGLTMAYNAVEAVVALWTAYRDHSVSLEAFGIDSLIELALGAVLMWRLAIETNRGSAERIEHAERRANWWAGLSFYGLAAFIMANAACVVGWRSESAPSLLAIGLAVASVLIMPVLAIAKKRVGREIGSSALMAEANCTWVCFYMSCTLLVGLLATRYLAWWWADPLAALVIIAWVVREGREAFDRAAGRDCSTCC